MILVLKKSIYDEFMKSHRKDTSKLVRQPKQIVRNGKTINTYVWVDPNKNKKNVAKKDVKSNNESMRVKQGLKKTEEIANYVENKLSKMGYKVKQDYSGLSNSRYITIENYKEITGKESKYNDSELKIRISDHDLPPSYDGLYGYHDIDVMSNNVRRYGNDGNVTDYETIVKELEKQVLPEIKETVKKKDSQVKKQEKEASLTLPD